MREKKKVSSKLSLQGSSFGPRTLPEQLFSRFHTGQGIRFEEDERGTIKPERLLWAIATVVV